MSTLVNGYQHIQNSDFLKHTSINDIQNWYVIDYDYDNLIDRSTYNDWVLVSRGDLLGQSVSGYFISVDYECAVQKIPALPAGDYEFSLQVYFSSSVDTEDFESTYFAVLNSD